MDTPTFDDPIEEAKYWRLKADAHIKQMLSVREEFDDFQISSRELELELETQLEQSDKRMKELMALNEKLKSEKESFQNRVVNNEDFINHEITRLQEELQKSKSEKEEMQRYIRQLEQVNDDLERSQRATVVTLEDFESRLNQAIERNAFLENELDEKADLLVTVQRLKDETRDLHQELAVTRRQREQSKTNTENGDLNSTSSLSNSDANSHPQERMVQTDICCLRDPTPLNPAVRIPALKMVNDALQKISHLEDKLSILCESCGGQKPIVSQSPSKVNKLSTQFINAHSPSGHYDVDIDGDSYNLSRLVDTDYRRAKLKSLHNHHRSQSSYQCSTNSGWLNGSASFESYRNVDRNSAHPLH